MPYDIEGEKVANDHGEEGWFDYEGGAGPLGAHVELDSNVQANKGKLPVTMLRRAKKQGGSYLGNSAVCEAGSHIRVVLRANVAYGLSYEAETDSTHRMGSWFCLAPKTNSVILPSVNRYDPRYSGTGAYTTIKVDDVPTLERNHPGVKWSQWFVFTVRAWNLTGFVDNDGKTFGTKLKAQGESTSVTVRPGGANPGDPIPIDESQFLRVRELFKAPGPPWGVNFRIFVYANADLIRQNVQAHQMATIGELED
jgi:hypothetical protein